uniref:Uncharacterized protein n=1 Tax=Daphnia galeata TaxID=27404 RepID=A0A8J2W8X6_9CRUS|nr:unnamed protein product [Daphnia galeata]
MMRSLTILMAIFLCETVVVSDVFLRIDLNDDQLERRYGDNSSDVTPLETDQKDVEQQTTFEIGQLSKDDESNSIPFGLSEREFQKYNKLLNKLKFKNFVINGPSAVSTPTTEESTTEETTPTTTFGINQRQEEIFPEDITDVDEDYDIIIMDQTQHILPILAPSGFGFFQAFVNLVRCGQVKRSFHSVVFSRTGVQNLKNLCRKKMSSFSSILQTLHTVLGKGVLGTCENTSSPAKQEWQERKAAVMKPGKRSYFIKSLWHVECSRCDHYLYQTEEEVEEEQGRLCVENYRAAFRSVKDCFDGIDNKSGKPWKIKYHALSSNDNVQVIKTLQKKWVKMFPSLDMGPVEEDMKSLLYADSYFQLACKQLPKISNPLNYAIRENYQKVIRSLAKVASAMDKPKISELILLYVNDKEFSLESNEPYAVTCWGEPAYAFLGGPLTERQLKWMMFAMNVAHVPDKESDRIRYEHDDEQTPESSENVDEMAPS